MKRLALKLVLLIVIVFGVFVATFIVATSFPGTSAGVEEIAAKFTPDPQWAETTHKITPYVWSCLSDDGCPSASLRWESPRSLTASEMTAFADGLGPEWVFTDSNCDVEQHCYLNGKVQSTNEDYYVGVGQDVSNNVATIYVNISRY